MTYLHSLWIPSVLKLEWLGVKPSEFQELDPEHLHDLTDHDKIKLESLLSRDIIPHDTVSANGLPIDELIKMREMGKKSEIEDFPFVSEYLYQKLKPFFEDV